MAQKPRNNKFALTPPPLPHIPTFRGWYFFACRFGFMRVWGECCGLIERVFLWHWVAKETALRLYGVW